MSDYRPAARSIRRPPPPADRKLVLSHDRLVGASFRGARLDWFSSEACRFERCDFRDFRAGDLAMGSGRTKSEYVDCVFDGSLIRKPSGRVRFERCSFRDCDLRQWYCQSVEMIDCVLSGVMRSGYFFAVPPYDPILHEQRPRNEILGNDFSGLEMIDVEFRTGVDLSRQTLPEGPEYLYLPDPGAPLRAARESVLSWPPSDVRTSVLNHIEGFEEQVARGQQQLFLGKYPRTYEVEYEANRRLIAVLREVLAAG